MAKKNFKETAAEQAPVYSKLLGGADQKAEKEAVNVVLDAQEVQATQEKSRLKAYSESLQTQGKRGEKLPRINMAFSPANHEFITIMSKLGGLTMTQYVNRIIDAEREANAEQLEQAKKLFDHFNL